MAMALQATTRPEVFVRRFTAGDHARAERATQAVHEHAVLAVSFRLSQSRADAIAATMSAGFPLNPEPTPADGEVGELNYYAGHGDADAQFRLARLYDSGVGVPENPANAAKWYQKAAEQGHSDAQFMMGELCATGDGLPKDPEEAATWYRRAAEQGHAKA